MEKLAHQNRERIPERVAHAKGWGASGTFTVTHDIAQYTRAKIFSEIDNKDRSPVAFFHRRGGGKTAAKFRDRVQ